MSLTRTSLRTSVGVLLIGLLALMSGCGGAEARKDRYLAKGQELMAEGSYEKARLEFRNALQIDPKDARARLSAGEAAERLGDIREAATMYQGVLANDEKNVTARARLGRLYVIAGLPDKALELVEPGFATAPKDAELLATRAAARLQKGDLAGARQDAEQAVAIAPKDENAVAVLAALMRGQGQSEQAIALLQKSVMALPKSVDLRLVLAQLLFDAGQAPAAEKQLQDVIRLQPDTLAHRLRLAQLHLVSKDVAGAEAVMREAAANAPDNVDAQLALLSLLAAHRSFEVADQQAARLRTERPDDLKLQLGLGEFYEVQGKPAQAEQVYRDIVKRDGTGPKGLSARNRIAAIQLRAGKRDDATKLIEAVLKANPGDADALVMRADLALAKGDTNAAITDLRAVLRDQPNAVPVQRGLARAYLQAGDTRLAEETLRLTVKANPGDLGVRLDLAQLLLRQGKPQEAAPVLEQLVKAEPNNLAALEGLFRVQLAAKDYPAALKSAQTIQALQPKLPAGHYLAGVAEVAQLRPEEARAAFEKAASLDPTLLDPVAALAQLDVTEKQPQRALARLDEYLARQPQNATAQGMKGELLLGTNRPSEAAASFAAAQAVNAKDWQPYRGQARAAMAQGNTDGAIAAYKAGIAATNGSPMLAVELAVLYQQQGRTDEAIAEYDAMLARDPRNDVAANNLAMLLVTHRTDAKSLARAGELSSRFEKSTNPALLDTYGWVLYKRGQYAAAVPPLEKAAKQAATAQELRYHLGMAQLKTGKRDEARANLEAATVGSPRYQGVEDARAALAGLK